jgi:hypothetical protein
MSEAKEHQGKEESVSKCPRCGGVISYIERQKKGGKYYYYAVHYLGYTKTSTGKVRKNVKKCYLGPETYDYVSKTHSDLGIVFEGAVEERRVIHYLDAFIMSLTKIELDKPTLIEIINKLKYLVERLEEIVKEE